jgi:uncharacterized protein (DUF849 family)
LRSGAPTDFPSSTTTTLPYMPRAALLYLKSLLPAGCQWSAFGLGRTEFPMVAQTFPLGGHVRVGFEDNVYISKRKLARDNAQLVEKCVNVFELLGGEVASAAEARAMLGLRARD